MKYLGTIAALCFALQVFAQKEIKVKIGPVPINQELPADLTNRVFWDQTDLFKLNLDQLAGSIIFTDDTATTFSRGPRIINSKNPVQVKTVQNGLRYHSKISKGFNASVKVLIFSGGTSNTQITDVKITDLLYVFIDYGTIPMDSVIKVASAVKGSGKKYYIQGALLTSIDCQLSDSVSTNGTITGTVFTVGGKVYKASDNFSEDFRISLTLIDLDKLKFFAAQSHLNDADEKKAIFRAATLEKSATIKITGF